MVITKFLKGVISFVAVSTILMLLIYSSPCQDSAKLRTLHQTLLDNDDLVVRGEIRPERKYAAFSTTSEWTPESVGFVFLLPLTALAWKRVGFDSVVIIVGSVDVWNSDSLFNHVFSSLRKLDAVVVFIKAQPHNSVMISQVSRIFAGSILRQLHAAGGNPDSSIDDVYLVTSDADLWPISASVYDTPVDADVLSLNAFCCGSFSFNGTSYRMLPIGNIAMRLSTWTEITRSDRQPVRSSEDIVDRVASLFGDVARRPVCKGENVGWYLDQRLISVLVKRFTELRGEQRVKLVERHTAVDRVDRSRWKVDSSATTKVDAHVLLNAYKPTVWTQLVPLVRELFGNKSDTVAWSMTYQEKFWKLFEERNSTLISQHC